MTPKLQDVALVSGETIRVQTDVEHRWFEEAKAGYLTQAKFEERTDLQDLDRLLCLELMQFRWNQHLTAGVDYEGMGTDDEQLRRNIKDQSVSIVALKDSMGLTKKARNALIEQGNVPEIWGTLKRRALEFGHYREDQLRTALRLMNELSAIVNSFDRADAEERRKLGFENHEEMIGWVRDVMLPEYRAVDEHFRNNVQRYWQRSLTDGHGA